MSAAQPIQLGAAVERGTAEGDRVSFRAEREMANRGRADKAAEQALNEAKQQTRLLGDIKAGQAGGARFEVVGID